MISFPNNIRFRFRDTDKDAQVIVGSKDYQKMIKKLCKEAKVSKSIAQNVFLQVAYKEIVRVYGVPSNLTLIIDGNQASVQ